MTVILKWALGIVVITGLVAVFVLLWPVLFAPSVSIGITILNRGTAPVVTIVCDPVTLEVSSVRVRPGEDPHVVLFRGESTEEFEQRFLTFVFLDQRGELLASQRNSGHELLAMKQINVPTQTRGAE